MGWGRLPNSALRFKKKLIHFDFPKYKSYEDSLHKIYLIWALLSPYTPGLSIDRFNTYIFWDSYQIAPLNEKSDSFWYPLVQELWG